MRWPDPQTAIKKEYWDISESSIPASAKTAWNQNIEVYEGFAFYTGYRGMEIFRTLR